MYCSLKGHFTKVRKQRLWVHYMPLTSSSKWITSPCVCTSNKWKQDVERSMERTWCDVRAFLGGTEVLGWTSFHSRMHCVKTGCLSTFRLFGSLSLGLDDRFCQGLDPFVPKLFQKAGWWFSDRQAKQIIKLFFFLRSWCCCIVFCVIHWFTETLLIFALCMLVHCTPSHAWVHGTLWRKFSEGYRSADTIVVIWPRYIIYQGGSFVWFLSTKYTIY